MISLIRRDAELENDAMQPDHESDELQSLLQGEYGAPRLDEQFSAGLMERLQAEVVSDSLPVSLPATRRRLRHSCS